ncbi:MAG: DUF1570 domain-containing protein [Planctomycetes bacterium]|nr:DUF1570 domain-containing protein [Planctomycetota bacterium]
MRERFRILLLGGLLALLLPAPAAPAAPPADPVPGAGRPLGVPSEGLDRVRLDDGRVISCRLEEPRGDEALLHFQTFVARIPKKRIVEKRLFADYDSTPRSKEEEAQAGRGLVRFGGRWITKEAAEKSVRAEEEEARKFREEDDKHSKWENRWIVETDHFRIEANIPREAVDRYGELLESFYDYFVKAFQIKLSQREKKNKLPVYLFRRRDEFRKFHDQDTGGRSESLLGYFVPAIGQERLVFFDMAGNRQETIDVMFHEGTHFIIHLAEPTVLVNRWVHEGCAEYFAACEYDGKRFRPGLVQDGRLLHFQEMIRAGRVLPLETLLAGGDPYPAGESPVEFGGEHYAQAWTLVHYLMEGKKGKYRAGFVNFLNLQLLKRGKLSPLEGGSRKYMDREEGKAALLRSIGVKDGNTLIEEVKEYAMTLPLRGAEAYVMRGEAHFYDGKAEEAEKDFAEALAKGGNDPKLLAHLARVYTYLPGKQAEALDLLRKSIALDPLDASTHFFLSRLVPPEEAYGILQTCLQVDPDHGLALGDYAWLTYLRLKNRDRAEDDEEKAVVRKAIESAKRAIAIDPSDTAYHALASLHLTLGEFDKALEAEKVAVEYSPEDLSYLWRVAECHALLGQPEDFARILRRIELLMRRAARPAEGETASEGGPSVEDIQAEMGQLVQRMVSKCLSWDLKVQAVAALDAWYEKRRPRTEEDWWFYADVYRQRGDMRRAGRIAADGLKEFPESKILEAVLTEAAASLPEGGKEGE